MKKQQSQPLETQGIAKKYSNNQHKHHSKTDNTTELLSHRSGILDHQRRIRLRIPANSPMLDDDPTGESSNLCNIISNFKAFLSVALNQE